jgi:tetratricopeptide (TPR) repeat protein
VALDLIWFYSNLIKVDFSDLYMEELGEIYLKLKLYLKAVPYLKKAERFQRCKFCFQQLLLLSDGDASKKAEVYEKWGDYYTSINLFEKSRSRYQDSLSVLLRPEEEKRQLIRKKFEATFFFETTPK